jgi:hypothetical protein
VTHGPHASSDGAITRAVKAPHCHPSPHPVAMVSLQERQGLVRWALMETQARLIDFSTISVMAITPALMATRVINASVLLVFSPYTKFLYRAFGPKAQHHFASSAPRFSLLCRCFSPPGSLLSHAKRKRQASSRANLL